MDQNNWYNQNNNYQQNNGYEQSYTNNGYEQSYTNNGYEQIYGDNNYNQMPKRKSKLSIVSLVLAIISLVCCCLFGWIAAILSIIFAIIALATNIKDVRAWVSIIISFIVIIITIITAVTGNTLENIVNESGLTNGVLDNGSYDIGEETGKEIYNKDGIRIYFKDIVEEADEDGYIYGPIIVLYTENDTESDCWITASTAKMDNDDIACTGFCSAPANGSEEWEVQLYSSDYNIDNIDVDVILDVTNYENNTNEYVKFTAN